MELIEKFNRNVRLFQWISAIVTAVIVILAIIFVPKSTPFWQFNIEDIYTLIISLAFVAIFIERAVEVIIKAWRDKDKQILMNKLSSEISDLDKSQKYEASIELQIYVSKTKSIALLLAFAFGVAISALGVRALLPLVDPAVYKNISFIQKALFTGVDTFITGALLGGGSEGMHKLMDAVLSFVDRYRSRVKLEILQLKNGKK